MSIAETRNREPPSKRKEKLDGQDREFEPHEMGLQVPRRVYTEGQAKAFVRGTAQAFGEVFRSLAQQKESQIEEGHLMVDHVHMMISIPPKAPGVAGGGLHQGQKRDPLGARVFGEEERNFVRAAFLGARVFCIDRRAR
jgi:hypothetical protein